MAQREQRREVSETVKTGQHDALRSVEENVSKCSEQKELCVKASKL